MDILAKQRRFKHRPDEPDQGIHDTCNYVIRYSLSGYGKGRYPVRALHCWKWLELSDVFLGTTNSPPGQVLSVRAVLD